VLALTGVALTFSACATVTPGPAITTPITYGCARGKSFKATYLASGRKAIVTAGGTDYMGKADYSLKETVGKIIEIAQRPKLNGEIKSQKPK